MSSIKIEGMEVEEEPLELPPGFRFHPTDEEIITQYLMRKATTENFQARAIGEADLNKSEPWELPGKAKMGEKEWYFFCRRERRYPTGMRTNRATDAGYWKATGKDKEIYEGKNRLVGMKKTLVFYKGRAPKGEKTNWVMHEYRLEGNFPQYNSPGTLKDSWVVCRVFHKGSGLVKAAEEEDDYLASSSMPSFIESPSYDPGDGSSYFFGSSSYIDAYQNNSDYNSGLQIDPYSTSYPHTFHYLDREKDHEFSFNGMDVLRGSAAEKTNRAPGFLDGGP